MTQWGIPDLANVREVTGLKSNLVLSHVTTGSALLSGDRAELERQRMCVNLVPATN